MLSQALEYFTAKAEEKKEFYYTKLGALSQTNEEEQSITHEKIIRSAERQRWSDVKSSPGELSVNDLQFVSHNQHFSTFKRSLAASVRIPYPFTVEQLKSKSYWIENSMIKRYDANEAVFPLLESHLVHEPNASKVENMFTEASIKLDPATLREQVYARKDVLDTGLDEERITKGLNAWEMFTEDIGFSETEAVFYKNYWIAINKFALDTSLDEERVAKGLNAWDMVTAAVGLSETELVFYKTFWKPTDKFALNTSLDEERVANGLNEWKMLALDLTKNDVCTSKQESILASRSSRGTLSAKLLRKRVSRLTMYFSKHKFARGRIITPCDVFFTECVSTQTSSDVAATFKKHQELEAALFATLVTKGATFTETFGTETNFKFRSPEAKTVMDGKMASRANKRAEKIRDRTKPQDV